ncbi:MAG: Ig-like domain-containing protein, partial [Thermoplasmata archaeon]
MEEKEMRKIWRGMSVLSPRKKVMVSYGFVTVLLLAAMLGGQYGGGVVMTSQSQYYPLPTILAVSPADENITTNETVITVFSTEMDKQSTENAFNITPYASGTFSWVDNYTMKFTPSEDLSNSTTYTITIDADTAKSPNNEYLDGNGNNVSEGSPTDDVVWDFATDDTSPAGGSLPFDQYPWLQFHKDRDRKGDYSQDAKYVSGKYSYNSKKRVDSSPIVESGLVLYGDNNGVVWAINETTMQKEWKRKIGNTPAKPTMVADDTYFWVATEGSSSKDPKLQKRQLKNGNQPPPPTGERGVKVKFENGRIYAPLTFVEAHPALSKDRIYVLVDYPNANPGTSVVFAFDR